MSDIRAPAARMLQQRSPKVTHQTDSANTFGWIQASRLTPSGRVDASTRQPAHSSAFIYVVRDPPRERRRRTHSLPRRTSHHCHLSWYFARRLCASSGRASLIRKLGRNISAGPRRQCCRRLGAEIARSRPAHRERRCGPHRLRHQASIRGSRNDSSAPAGAGSAPVP